MYVCMGVCLASSILFARQAAMIYVSKESGRQLVCIHCRCCGGVWVFFPWPWHDLHTWVSHMVEVGEILRIPTDIINIDGRHRWHSSIAAMFLAV